MFYLVRYSTITVLTGAQSLPLWSSWLTTLTLPWAEATLSTVRPSMSMVSTVQPQNNRRETTSAWPMLAATHRGDLPPASQWSTSASASSSSSQMSLEHRGQTHGVNSGAQCHRTQISHYKFNFTNKFFFNYKSKRQKCTHLKKKLLH